MQRSARVVVRSLWFVVAPLALLVFVANGLASEIVTLKSGLQIEGKMGKTAAMGESPDAPSPPGGDVRVTKIVFADDDLRRTFFSTNQIAGPFTAGVGTPEKIKIMQRVADGQRRVGGVGPIIKVTPFDEWGRRIFSMNTNKGQVDVIQGITEITPTYTKVEGLASGPGYTWDLRIATSSIHRKTLSAIIRKHIDPKNADQRFRIVRLYIQSDRFRDAEAELEVMLKDFPELAEVPKQIKSMHQANANRILKEIAQRRDVGQHELAFNMLTNFPADGVAGEILIKVRDELTEYTKLLEERKKVIALFEENLKKLEDEKLKARVLRVGQEIDREVNLNTLPRFAGFLGLAGGGGLTAEQELSLAISGWLLGNDSATENLAVSLNLFEVRNLVRAYVNAKEQPERNKILDQLRSLEGSDPSYLSKIVAHMKPPIASPLDETQNEKEPADENEIWGYFEHAIPGLTGKADIEYCIQLPPEYDPHRKYPCVVTLGGGGSTAQFQLEWWTGVYDKALNSRRGHASRRGYIVISPKWTYEHQKKYEYSVQEHSAVLFSLRDACRRYSIDTDRVFLSGHSMGGDAAWDIGLAHPDLWAGVIPISATADRFVTRYHENGRLLPMYFVQGQLDGDRMSKNKQDFDRYFIRAGYEALVVEYIGRGHEHFQDEITRIFTWMDLHKRNFFPKSFKVDSMRREDNFFWWVELSNYPDKSMVTPAAWPPENGARPITTTGDVLATNGVTVRTGAKQVKVWLSPEIVNFAKKIIINGKTANIKPSTEVLLEDLRTRGDRQHPFWAVWEN